MENAKNLLILGLTLFMTVSFQRVTTLEARFDSEMKCQQESITMLTQQKEELSSKVDSLKTELNSVFVFPTKDSKVDITSPFGWRKHPTSKRWRQHKGTDFGSYNPNAPLVAPFDGVVEKAGWISNSAGNGVWLTSDNKLYQARIYHMSEVDVSKGQCVSALDQLGLQGNTGRFSTGAHLHLEIWKRTTIGQDWELMNPLDLPYRHPVLASL